MLQHLWIIMDGNRRWAKERFLPSLAWHKAGADNIENIVHYAHTQWIKYITLWALSKDNLIKREKAEIEALFKLINSAESYLEKMIQKGLKFEIIGNIWELPEESQKILHKITERTKNNTGIVLILALVYGGQDEIIRGIKKFIANGGNISELDTVHFRSYLDTGKYPVVDLIIRTWGDSRHSCFLFFIFNFNRYFFFKKNCQKFINFAFQKALNVLRVPREIFGNNF